MATITEKEIEQAIKVSIHATLAGGDTDKSLLPYKQLDVSIHATLAGGDRRQPHLLLQKPRFLSTPPSRVATANCAAVVSVKSLFLSTPPSRVATENPLYGNQWRFVSIHATLAGGDAALYCDTAGVHRVSIHATLAGGDGGAGAARPPQAVSIHATLAGGDRSGACLY